MFKKFIIVVFLFSVSLVFSAPPELPSIFSDHMVLQRQMKVPIWGKADAGATVTVEFAGQKKSVTACDAGNWRVDLDAMEASAESRIMTVTAGENKIEFADVLVGEVWLCSGQSNMGWNLVKAEEADEFLPKSGNPLFRFYRAPMGSAETPLPRIDAEWVVYSPETGGTSSAVAYFFGRKLQEDLNVPVGLWQSAYGGATIDSFIPPQGFKTVESIKHLADTPSLTGNSVADRKLPSLNYNFMLHANIPFAIRGVIWYQGEANHTEGILYYDKTIAQLNSWRALWGYEFPFYFVQLPPYMYGKDDPEILPQFWEACETIVKNIPNTGKIIISDVTTLDNIHPPKKLIPGERLALLAEAKTYNMNVTYSGPVFEQMKISGNSIIILFKFADGLTTRDGNAPDWFEIAGADGEFKTATAKITGNTVVLTSTEVTAPAAARLGWHKLATPNLMNAAGIPAAPFNTARELWK